MLFVCFVVLFNDGHVLQLRPEIVAVRRRMRNGLDDYDGQRWERKKRRREREKEREELNACY